MIYNGAFRTFFAGAFLLVLCGVLGCEPEKMTDPKGVLEARASEYWDLRLMKKDYKATYDMELEKGMIPYEKYLKFVQNAGQMTYLSIKVEKVEVNGDKGEVLVKGRCRILVEPTPFESSLKDHWEVKNNVWKHKLAKKN